MRVSYVRKIKDQIPLSQSELNIIKFTLMNAIQHHNAGIIEPLLTRGVPLLMELYNNKTALRNAFEANNAKIVEILLIESLRTFQLFPVDDVIDCFKWTLKYRHYNLVDLMLFAVQQNPKSQKMFEKMIQAINGVEKLISLYKKNEVQPYHLKEYESVLETIPFDKPLFFYLHYRWNKEIGDKFTDSIECYRTLADFYLKKDLIQRKAKLQRSGLALIFYCISGLALCGLGGAFLSLGLSYGQSLIPLLMGIGLFGLFFSKSLSFQSSRKKMNDAIRDRLLMKACRDGDYAQASQLIDKGAHINCLCGIGETTALYEAMLFRNQPIANLLQQFNAYSGQGQETLLFP